MLDREEKTLEKIGIFLKTKRGQMFVSKLHNMSLKELCNRYNAPKFIRLYTSDRKNKNLILAAIKKYNVNIPVHKPITYYAPERIKYPVFLTKEEIRKIDAQRPSKKMGFAARMHAIEECMMNKFIAKHPAPTEKELAEDLFPEELKAGYNNMLYIRREYVRNFLCRKYAGTTPKETFFRIFTVLSVTKDPATGNEHKPVVSEIESNPSVVGYPFAHLDAKTPKEALHEILARTATTVHSADKNAIKVKLYNKYGGLIDTCKCAA